MKLLSTIGGILFLSPVLSSIAMGYVGPGEVLSDQDNQKKFSEFCTGTAISPEIPQVNYGSPLVQSAARSLSFNFNLTWFYSDIQDVYGMKKVDYEKYLYQQGVDNRGKAVGTFLYRKPEASFSSELRNAISEGRLARYKDKRGNEVTDSFYVDPRPVGKPAGVTSVAHTFLVNLCAEYRDRATYIEAMLEWAASMVKLEPGRQSEIDPSRSGYAFWEQLTAASYGRFIDFTETVFELRKAEIQKQGKLRIGSQSVDRPIPPLSVCETKYILSEYVDEEKDFPQKRDPDDKDKQIPDLEGYEDDLRDFSRNCSLADRNDYFDYRGDALFKPVSPASNGMVYYSRTMARRCRKAYKELNGYRTYSSIPEGTVFTSADSACTEYYSRPFLNKWKAARAGLAGMLFRHYRHDALFSVAYDDKDPRTQHIQMVVDPQEKNNAPFGVKLAAQENVFREFAPGWNPEYGMKQPGMDFSRFFQNNLGRAYLLLRDAVDRHTNWYRFGYTDLGEGYKMQKFYSPFVASSYIPKASDHFTAPGYTVSGDKDGRKAWMFVFRVKKENVYDSARLARGDTVDFDRMWLDETSLGTTRLAKKEKGFDRLGTPLESELTGGVVLNLHNIYHEIKENDGKDFKSHEDLGALVVE